MWGLKYYAAIEAAQLKSREAGVDLTTPFDVSDLGEDTWFTRLEHKLIFGSIAFAFVFLRRFRPVFKWGNLLVVSRAAEVRRVLIDREHFQVPFGPEMTELGGGDAFALGLDDEPHDWQRAIIVEAMPRSDIEAMREDARRITHALIANSRGRIDVMKDLFARVCAEVCLSYSGLTGVDPDTFGDWTLSISALLFADPTGSAKTRALALKGSAGVCGVIDRAFAQLPADPSPTNLLGKLKIKQKQDPRLTDGIIKAILVGLATGLIPTTTLGAGKIIEELRARPKEWSRAVEFATAGDKARLQTLLMEAARLNPALTPGIWRYVRKATTFTSRGKTIDAPVGTVVVVGTGSAMMDPLENPNPGQFRLDRPEDSFGLLFGTKWHECVGKWLSIALITEVAMIIFALPGMRPAPGRDGCMGWLGPYPRRLDVLFDQPESPSGFSLVTVAAPLAPTANAARVSQALIALGNPASGAIKSAVEQSKTLHFVSASVLDFGVEGAPKHYMVVEINADGDKTQAIAAAAEALETALGPIATEASGMRAPFRDFLRRNAINLETRPFGAIGLNFPGLGGLGVRDIGREERLATFAKAAVAHYFHLHLGRGARAMDALNFVRGLIRPDDATKAAIAADSSGKLAKLAERGKEFVDDMLLPSRRRLPMMDWTEPTIGSAVKGMLLDSTDLPLLKIGALLLFVVMWIWALSFAPWPTIDNWLVYGFAWLMAFALSFVIAVFLTLIVVALALFAAFAWLRKLETSDPIDTRDPNLSALRAAAAVEDGPGYAQNHFTSVSALKPGGFRKFTLALALWSIKELVTRYYRPGFVLDLGSINFARWFRPPGADKLVFFSNFDGSWHNYLEDFITKAHPGQSAVWSNGVGFPKTKFLMIDGAADGDSFKRWVRRQQVVTQFWCPRFPYLTANIKRANAIIHFGLARASDETQARDWLSEFGSVPRPDGVVESDEAQSLLFRNFANLPEGEYVALRFPDDPRRLAAWLNALTPSPEAAIGQGLGVNFGGYPSDEYNLEASASFVALSPSGLLKAGFPAGAEGRPSTEFPGAFNLGMASRKRILGDFGESAPENWRWSDAADAVLIVLGRTRQAASQCVERHLGLLGPESALHRARATPTDKGMGFEPFGFKDGISQPVIKGTRRHAKGVPDRDVIEAGELVLGYKNNGGYYAPSPTVPAQYDPYNRLPLKQTAPRASVPSLEASTEMRDFGRNGFYLAIRQLRTDVQGFDDQAQALVDGIERRPEVERAIGESINKEWIKAKMLGRWPSGEKLLDRPKPRREGDDNALDEDEDQEGASAPRRKKHPDNDFDFGTDDPEGFRCPIGAHVRRSNPRASLGHDDPDSQMIVNRHRILRRGRPYKQAMPDGGVEQGLMFVAICADIERQFEFIQQTWANANSFEDLRDEPDPLIGSNEGLMTERAFTIPTAFGPLCFTGLKKFVEVKGGGYFFMPSRSALMFLADSLATQVRRMASVAST